ncbi:hypothetical protein GIB67_024111 [Kingdonia uniflora]|uniref:Uncharacterized protein n=1 Tax=Kingdonia uniflora TaxID=39325 RepID=A0A7J7MMQ6_9MAGN|nr:hypothetical protein GIB67_024111 [Kingdonia uniflora]
MHMPEGEPHPSTMPGLRGARDPKRAVTRSSLDTAVMTRVAITGFVQLLMYLFYEYCGVGHLIVKEKDVLTAKLLSRKRMPLQVPNGNCEYYLGDKGWRQLEGEACIPLNPLLSMSPHISPAALLKMRHTGFLDCEQFVDLQRRRGYDVRVVPIPPGGGARTGQRGSGLRTRGGVTSHNGAGYWR